MILRGWRPAALVAVVIMAAIGAAGALATSNTAPLCAFRESTVKNGNMATTTFHVVKDGCLLSFVSISKFANGNALFDTATGTFNASPTLQTMTVQLPCGVSSETDLILGPPSIYPPVDLDLGATAFAEFACPAAAAAGPVAEAAAVEAAAAEAGWRRRRNRSAPRPRDDRHGLADNRRPPRRQGHGDHHGDQQGQGRRRLRCAPPPEEQPTENVKTWEFTYKYLGLSATAFGLSNAVSASGLSTFGAGATIGTVATGIGLIAGAAWLGVSIGVYYDKLNEAKSDWVTRMSSAALMTGVALGRDKAHLAPTTMDIDAPLNDRGKQLWAQMFEDWNKQLKDYLWQGITHGNTGFIEEGFWTDERGMHRGDLYDENGNNLGRYLYGDEAIQYHLNWAVHQIAAETFDILRDWQIESKVRLKPQLIQTYRQHARLKKIVGSPQI